MTRTELQQYKILGREIQQLQARRGEIKRSFSALNQSAIAVKGSLPYFPYTEHRVMVGTGETLRGAYQEEIQDINAAIARLLTQRRRIRSFVDGIQDSELRQIFSLRYLEGISWSSVTKQMGPGYSTDAVRKRHDRYFKGR